MKSINKRKEKTHNSQSTPVIAQMVDGNGNGDAAADADAIMPVKFVSF